jgi:ribosomal RNA-processing protein 36
MNTQAISNTSSSSNNGDSDLGTSDSSTSSFDDDPMDSSDKEEGDECQAPEATSTWRSIRRGIQGNTIQGVLQQPTVEERLRMRQQQGSKGTKHPTLKQSSTKDDEEASVEYNPHERDTSNTTTGKDQKQSKSKHAPTEVSSKKRDFYNRQNTSSSLGSRGVNFEATSIVHHYKPRDPRSIITETSTITAGKRQRYDKEYEFLDDIIKTEIQTLKERIAARKVTGKKGKRVRRRLNICNDGNQEEDQLKLKQLKEQLTQRLRAAAERDAKVALKQKMEQDIAEGNKPVRFLKRKERRQLELETTFEELRKRGGDAAVNKAIAKRRKKNASKDHKYVPLTHPK